MKTKRSIAGLLTASLVLAPLAALAADIHVMSSAGFKAAYLELVQKFEQKTGHHVVNAWGPSMGATPQAVPNRLARGEPADVVIGVREALDKLGAEGKVDAKSETDLAKSLIGAVVRAGAPHPDISTAAAFKTALENAKSIAYSDSASGVYIETVIYTKLGVGDAVKAKSRMIPADPVGEVVARGDAELGFQQLSELKPVKGIDLLGPIPAEVQKVTTFTAAIAANAKERTAGEALIRFLSAPEAVEAIRRSGMEPVKGE
ncbi:MAG: molybdate transport system substrate-binding protein [Methylobacteriaceae bacterium]|jgi:molybdate transport system substrate-binding protein|nr:molybdate transport system substrate-binding protein [Methylobacteriaceae bacterium]